VVGSFEGESGDLEGAADVVGSEAYETKTSSMILDLGSHFYGTCDGELLRAASYT